VTQKEKNEERGPEHGLFLKIIGNKVRQAYRMTQIPIQAVTTAKMVCTLNKNTARPAKRRKREIWSSAVNA
jgi:hypothetical protein